MNTPTETSEEESSDEEALGAPIAFFWLFAIAAYLCTVVSSPAVFGHLVYGRWILNHGTLPRENLWTTFGSDSFWVIKDCLFSVMLALVEHAGADVGLGLLKLLGCCFCVFALSHSFVSRSKHLFFGSILACVTACGLLIQAPLEPELFGWSFFILVLNILYLGSDISNRKRYLLLFCIGVMYSNVHSQGALITAVLLVIVCTAKHDHEGFHYGHCIIFSLALCCNPTHVLQVVTAAQHLAQDWYLAFYLRNSPSTLYDFPLAFLVLLWMVLGIFLHHRSGLHLIEYVLLAVISVSSLASTMCIPYALILVSFFIAILWGDKGGTDLGPLAQAIIEIRNLFRKLSPFGVLWLALCIAIVNTVNLVRVPFNSAALPESELSFILEQTNTQPVLHSAAIAPYVRYRFSTDQGEPIRNTAVELQSNILSRTELHQVLALDSLGPGWRDLFERINPGVVLVRKGVPLYSLLLVDSEWSLRFEGGQVVDTIPASPTSQLLENYVWAVFTK